VKGLYAKALAGEIERFTGISDPYEEPISPDITVDSSMESVEESASRVLSRIFDIDDLREPLTGDHFCAASL